MTPRSPRPLARLLSAFLLPALCIGSLFTAGCSANRPPDAAVLENVYRAAVRDAAVADPWEISRRLRAVVEYDPLLVWRGERGKSPVLVVTWRGWPGYDEAVGGETTLERPVWVTLVPDVQRFCRGFGARGEAALALRLEQLLGLPPGDGKDRFVQMWVERVDLFRSCPDPEITDNQCSLYTLETPFSQVSAEHREWMAQLVAKTYGEDGHPQTRLGYTYDWGNPRTEVGLSEFVIRNGATVGVESVTPTAAYCSR